MMPLLLSVPIEPPSSLLTPTPETPLMMPLLVSVLIEPTLPTPKVRTLVPLPP